jgi:urocanate hydratase
MLDDLVVHQQSVGDRVGCYLPPGVSQKDTEQLLKDNYPEWLPQLYRTHLVSLKN